MGVMSIFRGKRTAPPPKPGKPQANTDKTEAELALAAANPIEGIGISDVTSIYNAARTGNTTSLFRVYEEIEKTDPTLLACVERRTRAVDRLGWRVEPTDSRASGFDAVLADEQAQAVSAWLASAKHFSGAIKHLSGAFFTGHGHIQPRLLTDGTLLGFDLIDPWNVVRDLSRGVWQWNPDCAGGTPGPDSPFRDIPAHDHLVSLQVRRPIDWPASLIYIRSALGERGWGQFVDRYGLPPALLTMPSAVPDDDKNLFLQAAKAIADGRSAALPFGTAVSFAESARGVDPFSVYLRHQQELTVLLATGGRLTMLTEAGSGTLAGNAHMDTWHEVVLGDSAAIAEAIQEQLVEWWLTQVAFPGRPVCAELTFNAEQTPTPSEVLDDAVKARSAGYVIDARQMSEKTGYEIKLAPEPAGIGFGATPPSVENRATPLHFASSPLQNAPTGEDGSLRVQNDAEPSEGILEAFGSDLGAAAERLRELWSLPDDQQREAAKKLAEELPDLMPQDSELAGAVEDAIMKEFAEKMEEEKR